MINQIEIASEQKDSNLASTLAHETRKNNAGRILFLSLCVVVAIVGAALITACGNGDDVDEDEPIGTSVVTSINAEVAGVNSSVTTVRLGYTVESDEEIRINGQGTFANGRINIDLSQTGAPQVRRFFNFDNDDGITNSNPNAIVIMYDGLIGYDANGTILGWFKYKNLENMSYAYITYSDGDVTVTGYSSGDRSNGWNVSLKRGWNFVYVTRFGPAAWQYSTSDPGNLRWYWEDEPGVTKENYYLEFTNVDTRVAVRQLLQYQEIDTVFLVPGLSWGKLPLDFIQDRTAVLKTVFDIDEDRVWGSGILDPDEIYKADSAYLAGRKFEIQAGKVVAD